MRLREWLLIGTVAVVFAPAVMDMAEVWGRLDYYSHGYLVPLVSLWVATSKRRLLAKTTPEVDRRGFVVLGFALTLDLVGTVASMLWLQGLSVVLAVAGAVLYLRGAAWLRALAFPVGFLAFMIPLPNAVVTPVITELQLFVSTAGVSILHAMGVSVFREGNVLQLPGGESLFVAEACSGITSIITFIPLAVFLAYFTERSLGRRALLVASVVPVAMLGNLLRVLGIVLAARSYGVELATRSEVHDSAGFLVYVLGCLALIGIGRLMRLVKPTGPATA